MNALNDNICTNSESVRRDEMSIAQEERLLSVSEAARRIGVSPSTVWRWIDAQRLPAVRIGLRKIRIRETDAQAMIAPARASEGVPAPTTRPEPDRRPSEEELARRQQLFDELMEFRRNIPKEWLTATEAMAIADAMQLEHDERAAGIRR
jgi:excisionase family DNA binding protein